MPNAFETAVTAVVSGYRASHAGQRDPAGIANKIAAARAAGYKHPDIFNEASRRWGQELIDHANR